MFKLLVCPLGGAKVETLDPIFSVPMDRKWIKFGTIVDLGDLKLYPETQSPPTPRDPPRNFGVFENVGGGARNLIFFLNL